MNWCNRCTSAGSNNLPAIKVCAVRRLRRNCV
jgi:hypothetical protein